MAYDWDRLGRAIRDARSRLGWTQAELARRASVDLSTIKNLEGRHSFVRWPKTVGAIELSLGKPEGWARAVAEGHEPPRGHTLAMTETNPATPRGERRGLIDPESPDPVIRELSTGPVAGGDEFREQLIRLYLDDVAEGERRLRRRAAERALKLAAASLGPSPSQAELVRKLDRLEEIEREIEAEDTAKDSDTAGQGRDLA